MRTSNTFVWCAKINLRFGNCVSIWLEHDCRKIHRFPVCFQPWSRCSWSKKVSFQFCVWRLKTLPGVKRIDPKPPWSECTRTSTLRVIRNVWFLTFCLKASSCGSLPDVQEHFATHNTKGCTQKFLSGSANCGTDLREFFRNKLHKDTTAVWRACPPCLQNVNHKIGERIKLPVQNRELLHHDGLDWDSHLLSSSASRLR